MCLHVGFGAALFLAAIIRAHVFGLLLQMHVRNVFFEVSLGLACVVALITLIIAFGRMRKYMALKVTKTFIGVATLSTLMKLFVLFQNVQLQKFGRLKTHTTSSSAESVSFRHLSKWMFFWCLVFVKMWFVWYSECLKINVKGLKIIAY